MMAHSIEIPISSLKQRVSGTKSGNRCKSSNRSQGVGILSKKLNFIREMNEEVSRLMEDEDINGDLTSNTQSMSNTIKKSKKKNQR